ncbi:MAG: ribosome small subunit-dependent GTPase A [Bacteroidetes bacterium GWF2_49_14]|nr:MAG: ribosome small subunit-dependent GTPase A [Bacteroidetes bacterium GWF2_49_14]HBB91690.1 ribosome small subunit-dependent GTPase A [Bacteroidales bacterium]
MNLTSLGYTPNLDRFRTSAQLEGFEVGRVIIEHKERYIVKTSAGEFDAEITGNMRFTAQSREDFPAVGDWVALTVYDQDLAIIQSIFPRSSVIRRQAVGHDGETQVIAANIDFAFLVQAVDRDVSINRLERYLSICFDSGIEPIIILSKTDLIPEEKLNEITANVQNRVKDVPVVTLSNETGSGFDAIDSLILKGKTYCLLGSSGVGKSTLLNRLSGRDLMKTAPISETIQRGRHVTSHRELIVLENGGILIDNPGMREVGTADAGEGLGQTFNAILSLGEKCRFADCTHTSELGCAVLAAVEEGRIDAASYENYLKLRREQAHFETSAAEKRKKDKIFGKMLKDYNQKDPKQRKS